MSVSETEQQKKKTKSYIGCNTCRKRKIGCDKTRPTCLNCKKSRFVCEGYDIRLNWLSQIKFDKYGNQLPWEQKEETEFTRRSKIDFVKYSEDEIYKHYDEMDEDLNILQKAKGDQLDGDKYLSQGLFGVFKGKTVSKRASPGAQPYPTKKQQVYNQSTMSNGTNNGNILMNDASAIMGPPQNAYGRNAKMSMVRQPLFQPQHQQQQQQFPSPHHAQQQNIQQQPFQINDSFGGSEWLSTELIDGAMITASALNGDTYFIDLFNKGDPNNNMAQQQPALNSTTPINNQMQPTLTSATPSSNMVQSSAMSPSGSSQQLDNTNPNMTNSIMSPETVKSTFSNSADGDGQMSQINMFDTLPDEMLHMLFQGRNEGDNVNNPVIQPNAGHQSFSNPLLLQQIYEPPSVNQSGISSTNNKMANSMINQQQQAQPPKTQNQVRLQQQFKDEEPTDKRPTVFNTENITFPNLINLHAGNGARMPPRVMEIKQNLKELPDSLAISKFPTLPTTSFSINPMARYLLNYYIEDVADMMTVIPLPKNPWKFIYFPRAIMAIGELGSLGTTSNAKNCLLNALLAVSAFNLQSKFPRGSKEMKFYVDLGVQLRQQATQFLNKCLEEDILKQKYKDVLVAVLSMVTIDVVWGTMASCKIHLDHCEKIIEKKMTVKSKLSNKAIILHRIFSSLKLIQDSTCLDNIDESEIFLNENNYKNFIIGGGNFKNEKEKYSHNGFIGLFKSRRQHERLRLRSSRKTNTIKHNASKRGNENGKSINYGTHEQNESDESDGNEEDKDNEHESDEDENGRSGSRAPQEESKGVFNEKITNNGKIRIEYIVNGVDSDGNDSRSNSRLSNSNSAINYNDNNMSNEINNNVSDFDSSKGKPNDYQDEGINNSQNVASSPEQHYTPSGNKLDGSIPAFIDITRTSFQPSKNKIDDKVISSDAIYGLPNSLILMFSEVVHLVRFKRYMELNDKKIPFFFDELSQQLEYKLLNWKLEWKLTVDDNLGTPGSTTSSTSIGSQPHEKKNFISTRYEGIYHHVMSFYYGLIIYFYRFVEDVNAMHQQDMVNNVLSHLNEIQRIVETGAGSPDTYIIPLFWQGFIAGSEAMTLFLQKGFNTWGQNIAVSGIGTYWNARQIMLETWRRKNQNVTNSSWTDVLRDWKTNVMLT